jgi:hypothetical protein
VYDRLLAAFRQTPSNYSAAAKAAGVGFKLSRRAWHDGWPRANLRAVQDVLRDEEVAARAEQYRQSREYQQKAAEERDKARQDAVTAMAQEGRILSLARNDVQGALACAAVMLPALRTLSERVAAELTANPGQLSPAKGVELIQRYAHAVRSLTQAGEQLVRAERLHKGEPTDILGVAASAAEMSVEEAAKEIRAASQLYELAKRRGLIPPDPEDASTIIDGHGGNGTNGAPPGTPVN